MTIGFKPAMPLEFYADFNKAIFPRIPTGDNDLNKDEIKDLYKLYKDQTIKLIEK